MSQLEQILIEVEQNVKWKLPSSFTLTEGLLMKYFVSSLSGEEVTKLWNKNHDIKQLIMLDYYKKNTLRNIDTFIEVDDPQDQLDLLLFSLNQSPLKTSQPKSLFSQGNFNLSVVVDEYLKLFNKFDPHNHQDQLFSRLEIF